MAHLGILPTAESKDVRADASRLCLRPRIIDDASRIPTVAPDYNDLLRDPSVSLLEPW
jgi:hypothetical protein